MRVRGERECTQCGHRWSYFETGSVECPACGSPRSVGRDERRQHTDDAAADLDLTGPRERADDGDLPGAVEEAAADCREYVRRRGFVVGGDLRDLDGQYLAAAELAHAADLVDRRPREGVDDGERAYLLGLLAGADRGDRPDADRVPESLRAARGATAADAVRAYRRELRSWLDEVDRADDARTVPAVRESLDELDGLLSRYRALEGDVPPDEADALVEVARDVGRALRDGDETALATARERLDGLIDR